MGRIAKTSQDNINMPLLNKGFETMSNLRKTFIDKANELKTESAEALRDSTMEYESQFSGVNLDEEAANLIEQQQAYQASARILSTARELFDTLLNSV